MIQILVLAALQDNKATHLFRKRLAACSDEFIAAKRSLAPLRIAEGLNERSLVTTVS